MGFNNKTILEVGCLMSSIAEALYGWKIKIPLSKGKFPKKVECNPGTLNTWLRNNGGYLNGTSILIYKTLEKISPWIKWPKDGFHKNNDLSPK